MVTIRGQIVVFERSVLPLDAVVGRNTHME